VESAEDEIGAPRADLIVRVEAWRGVVSRGKLEAEDQPRGQVLGKACVHAHDFHFTDGGGVEPIDRCGDRIFRNEGASANRW